MKADRRGSVGIIYFGVVLMTLLLRVSSALDVYSAVGTSDIDAYFTCVVQILIFGVMSLALFSLTVSRREGLGVRGTLKAFGFVGISRKNALRTAVLAVCMIVIGSAFSYMWQLALAMIGYTHVPSSTDYSSVGLLFKDLALTAMLPAIFEEVAHRGLLYAGYKETGWKFVLVSALTFSLMHQNIVQTGYTFADGAVMALAMYYTGSIYPGMFMHFANNFWAVFSGYAAQNGGIWDFINVAERFMTGTAAGIALSIVGVTACAALIIVLFIGMRKDAVKAGRIDPSPFYSPAELPDEEDFVYRREERGDKEYIPCDTQVEGDCEKADALRDLQNVESCGNEARILCDEKEEVRDYDKEAERLLENYAFEGKERPMREVPPLYKDIPFLVTVALGVAATLFSFVWGMIR